MGLIQIGASVIAALLVGALTRGTIRVYFLLALSVLAIYWFQPILPFRSFDFWLPSLSLILVLVTWFITSGSGPWRTRINLIGLSLIAGIVILVDLLRYILPEPILTASTPPRLSLVLIFFGMVAGVVFLIVHLPRK